MAYLDDEALARDLNRQRMLAGLTPIALGDPISQIQAPQGVNVDKPQQMFVPQYPRTRPGGAEPERYRNDNSLAEALGSLGQNSGIQALLKRLQASQQPPPSASLRDRARAGHTLTTPQPPQPGQSPQQLIPGLQPPIDASKAMPGTPAANAYMTEHSAPRPGAPAAPGADATLAPGRDFGRVNPQFMQAVKEYAQIYHGQGGPYSVSLTSGYRSGSGQSEHGRGNAIDMQLVDKKTGTPLPNYQTNDPKVFGAYQDYANGFHQYLEQKYPDLAKDHRWGGYFSGPKGKYGANDIMHHDLGGSHSGMLGGSWEKGLNPEQAKLFGLTPGGGTAGRQPVTAQPHDTGFGTQTTAPGVAGVEAPARAAAGGNVQSWTNFAMRPVDQGGLGLSQHQAAGLVANLQHESTPNITPWGETGDRGTAFGAAQWRNERVNGPNGLMAFAKANGLDYHTTETQQQFMRHELLGGERKAYDALRSAGTPEQAATSFNRLYERSSDTTSNRMNTARQLYNEAQRGPQQPAAAGSAAPMPPAPQTPAPAATAPWPPQATAAAPPAVTPAAAPPPATIPAEVKPPAAPLPPPASAPAVAAAPAAPPAVAPAAPKPSGLDAAHRMLDTKVIDLVKANAPDQVGSVPGFIGNKTLREAINTPLVGGQIRSGIAPHLGKMGVSPADFDKAVASPPPAPGKRSDAGTSDVTDFSARARTPEAPPPTPTTPGNLDPGSQPAVQNADGSISTVRTIGANVDGKETNLPTVSPDGKILTNDQAVQQYRDSGKHLGQYNTPEDAGRAAQALHEQEANQISQAPKGVQPPQQQQPVSSQQVSPEMAKAFVEAFKNEETGPPQPIPPGAQPVLPSEVAPAGPGAPGGPIAPGAGPGAALPPGGGIAPMMMTPGSQGSSIATAGIMPVQPVQAAPMTTQITNQPIGQLWQPPIPWENMSSWGWGGGGGGGFSGFDTGGGGGFSFGGFGGGD